MSLLPDQHMLADPNAGHGTSHPQAHPALYAMGSGPLGVGVHMSVPVGGLPMHFPAFADTGHVLGAAGVAGAQQLDPNTPELFKHNIEAAHQSVVRIQQTAQNVIAAIERAYQPNGNQVMQASAEIISLKHMLETFAEFLRETGVGSLPLMLPPPAPAPATEPQAGDTEAPGIVAPSGTGLGLPTEQEMIENTVNAVKRLYEKRQRMQDNAASVANLMGGSLMNNAGGTTGVAAATAATGVDTPDERGRKSAV